MSSKVKSVKAETKATVAAPAPVAVAPVVEKKAAKKEKVVEKVAEPVKVEAKKVETVAAPVAETASETSTVSSTEMIQTLITSFESMISTARSNIQQLKALRSQIAKEIKSSRKGKRAEKVDENGNVIRTPSSVEKPEPISDELAAFLGKKEKSEVRGNVTRFISSYAKSRGIAKGREITLDGTLAKLCRLAEGTVINYFTLQSHIKHHYPRAVENAKKKSNKA
jgi:hypothetical protein